MVLSVTPKDADYNSHDPQPITLSPSFKHIILLSQLITLLLLKNMDSQCFFVKSRSSIASVTSPSICQLPVLMCVGLHPASHLMTQSCLLHVCLLFISHFGVLLSPFVYLLHWFLIKPGNLHLHLLLGETDLFSLCVCFPIKFILYISPNIQRLQYISLYLPFFF